MISNKAHHAVRMAVVAGVLPQLGKGNVRCVDCGEVAVEYDHRNYGEPLNVSPVCRKCNHKRGNADGYQGGKQDKLENPSKFREWSEPNPVRKINRGGVYRISRQPK